MPVAVVVPLVVSVLLGAAGPWLARAVPPAAAVRLLTLGALTAALATGFSLTVAALVLVAGVGDVAVLGQWSTADLRVFPDVPWPVGLAVGGLVAVLLSAAAVHALRAGAQLWTAELLCRRLGSARGGDLLVTVDDDTPDAYAVPGVRGQVVVTTGMLAALSTAERRVLLAHEASHLAHRHHLWIQLSELAAVANPFLRSVPPVVRHASERWADEDAARAVGDRRITAHAIARAALVTAAHRRASLPSSAAGVSLAATGADVPSRVRDLLNPPRLRWSPFAAAVLAAAVFSALTSSVALGSTTEHRFERARAANAQHIAAATPATPADTRVAARRADQAHEG